MIIIKDPSWVDTHFWTRMKVNEETGCWEWQGPKLRGYGEVRHANQRIGAHRLAFELTYGPIPPGLFVLHRCDNPPCIRPEHLTVGTQKENNQDRHRKGRSAPMPPHAKGEQTASAKLTEADVIRIRELGGILSRKELAREFGVGPTTILRILNGSHWKHVKSDHPSWDYQRSLDVRERLATAPMSPLVVDLVDALHEIERLQRLVVLIRKTGQVRRDCMTERDLLSADPARSVFDMALYEEGL